MIPGIEIIPQGCAGVSPPAGGVMISGWDAEPEAPEIQFMWLFTKYGFYSAVCARQGDGGYGQPVDENRVMVRARVRQHLDALKKRFPELLGDVEICVFQGSDYAFRIFVPKSTWAAVTAALAEELSYDNFKAEAARGDAGDDYEAALHDVWGVMHRLQRRR
jgi:hypothetical protein